MDSFAEQIIKQSLDGKRLALVLGLSAFSVAVCAVVAYFIPFVLVPVIMILAIAVGWVATLQSWEVEYAVTNGDIDIDRIVAKRDRKTIVRVRGEKIESLLPMKELDTSKSYDRVVMASASKRTATWFFTYHSPKSGSTIVFFEPNERVLDALKKGLPRTVLLETERASRWMN